RTAARRLPRPGLGPRHPDRHPHQQRRSARRPGVRRRTPAGKGPARLRSGARLAAGKRTHAGAGRLMNAIHAIDDYVDLLLSLAPSEAKPTAPRALEAHPHPSTRPRHRDATPAGQPQPRPPEDPDALLARWLSLRCGEQTYALEQLKI